MSVQVKTTDGDVVVEGAKTWMTEGGCLKLFGPVNERNECLTEFAANYWLTVKAGNGAVAIPPAAAPAALPAQSPAVAAWAEKANCPVCQKLGLKTSKGYSPKLWVNDKVGLQCNGVDVAGAYQNHSLNGFAAGAYAEILA